MKKILFLLAFSTAFFISQANAQKKPSETYFIMEFTGQTMTVLDIKTCYYKKFRMPGRNPTGFGGKHVVKSWEECPAVIYL
ncbi:MAG: hypothetical protein ACRCXK_05945 [Wohlfahrtiimonas sp.]